MLDEIHNTVVAIVQGGSAPAAQGAAAANNTAPRQEASARTKGDGGPSHRVDVRG